VTDEVEAQIVRMYQKWSGALVGYATSWTGGDLGEAEGLVDDAFHLLYQKWDQIAGFNDQGRYGWLRRVTRNRAVDAFRRRVRIPLLVDPLENTGCLDEPCADADPVHALLAHEREPEATVLSDADTVEQHPCPRCGVQPGSPCRSRSGAVARTYHTGRFTKVPRLAKLLRVPTPANRGPGQPWRPGTSPPAPIPADTPAADIRVGYARCSHFTQELQLQLDALATHGIPRDKIFAEKVSTRVRVRPKFEAALEQCRQIKAHAPHCRVILTVYEMKRLGRDSAELTALADHLVAHGIVLEMLAGPLTGIYDPTGTGRVLFAFFAAMAETERENIREATLEGLNAAARKGNHGGRPPVITDDMLHTVLRRRANGESIEDIRPDLIIPTGKRKGRNPSLASIYRALAEHKKHQVYPEAIEQAHTDFAELQVTT
jgi:DNA invertase Pin-like site-specific DNA recombinase